MKTFTIFTIFLFLFLKSFSQPYSIAAKNYFKKVTGKEEFSGKLREPTRWESNMKIFVKGKRDPQLLAELKSIVAELNSIINTIEIQIVNTESQSNFIIFFGSQEDFHVIEPESAKWTEDNLGLFIIYPTDRVIHSGNMYVDIYRLDDDLQAQKHLLREELTQSLGLYNDTWDYPNSIFYQGWTTTTKYAPIDIELIKMLYN